jgi:hypothetical protein
MNIRRELLLRRPLPPSLIRPQRLDDVLHLRLELLRTFLPTRKVRRLLSGHFTCYLNRTYHVLLILEQESLFVASENVRFS